MREETLDLPGLRVREVTLDVPLDRTDPARGTIEVFARIVAAHDGGDRPYAVYLQGGPGVEAPRPSLEPASPSWLPRVLADYRLILLDQRGTGRSTPLGLDTPAPGLRDDSVPEAGRTLRTASPAAAAEYLTHFSADAIVLDALDVLGHLGADTVTPIGQSFGGFTTVHWLSAHPESLAGAGEILLPSGQSVSPARLRTLGHRLGATGGAEQLHWLLQLDHRGPAFRHDLAAMLPFGGRNPLYAVLHESSMANGHPTDWAAETTMPDDVRADPTLLGGEHLHPGLFDEDAELAPWREIAHRVAQHPWPALYDPEALQRVRVPAAAIVYFDDAYVPTAHSLETAALMPTLTPWVTNEWEHNGIRASGTEVIDRLIGLVRGQRLA